ncbi:hypothetical protein GQ600_4495 [Phytophthora cactorum]|nr:hypothetical protein GQ600_4495 [Phytophthora cactorum]
MGTETPEEEERDEREIELELEARRILLKRRRVASSEEGAEEETVEMENREEDKWKNPVLQTGSSPNDWMALSGYLPDAFYRDNVELVIAFAKYYVGTMSAEELAVLSKFKHSSDTNLNLEGRKLKQAAMAAVQHFCGPAKNFSAHKGSGRAKAITARNERFDRVQQPLSMEVMLQLQSLDSSMHDGGAAAVAPEAMQSQEGSVQQPTSPNGYLIQQSAAATEVIERQDRFGAKKAIKKYAVTAKVCASSRIRKISRMAVFVALLLLVAVAVVGFAFRHWLTGRLSPMKDHSKKQEELDTDGVEIVIQKPVHERRLKLALPDISSIQVRSPVGPMKSSIRSALKELRSRQMVQSLCRATQQTKTRRRDARDAIVAPVLLASDLTKEAGITASARSNNLNKFLRSYASNLDNAVSAERRVVMDADAISVERSVVMSATVKMTSSSHYLSRLKRPRTVPALVDVTDCEPLVDEEPDEGNNNRTMKRGTAARLSIAFTLVDFPDVTKKMVPESSDNRPETCSDPPAKEALARFKKQVPSNGRRARTIATLKI